MLVKEQRAICGSNASQRLLLALNEPDASRRCVVAVIEFMEVGIGEPGFVEMQNLDRISDELLDGIDIVAKAVIGGICHYHQPNLAVRIFGKRAGIHLATDGVCGELLARDGSYDAKAI